MFSKAEIKKDLEHSLPDPGKDPRAHETRTEGLRMVLQGDRMGLCERS